MYTETEEVKKTNIYEDVIKETDEMKPLKVSISVDHCDKETPFLCSDFENLNDDALTLDDLNRLRKLLNKAVAVHKTGFKS